MGPRWSNGWKKRTTFSRYTIARPFSEPIIQLDIWNGTAYTAIPSAIAGIEYQLKNHKLLATNHRQRSFRSPRPIPSASPRHPSFRHENAPITKIGSTNPSSPLVSEVAAMISHSPTTHGPPA